jgi:hypothetical protein
MQFLTEDEKQLIQEPLFSVSLLVAGYTATAALARAGTAVSREAGIVRKYATRVVEWAEQSEALFRVKSRALRFLPGFTARLLDELNA